MIITDVRRFGAGTAELDLAGLRRDLDTLKKEYVTSVRRAAP